MNESTHLVEAFEQEWASGAAPELDDYLSDQAIGRRLLSQLVCIDQRERWRRGERFSAEDYLARYPALQADEEYAVDLIYHEYLLRADSAAPPSLDEFRRRFPQFGDALASQIKLHLALAAGAACTARDDASSSQTMRNEHVEDDSSAALPEVFGRYRVRELLGRGAMGAVYEVEDVQLGRRVALKLPRCDRGRSPQVIEQLHHEARIAATFHHPNLCPVYDFGEVNGAFFLTMPRLYGQLLSERLKVESLSELAAVRIVLKIARAMSVAHGAGVIHRDLKPSNVLVQEGDEPVVMDFGLARLASQGASGGSSFRTLVGTLAYMAPEQLEARDADVGATSDVYSLGVILYELLTGAPPFAGTWHEVVEQVQFRPPIPPQQLAPAISTAVSDICVRALAKDPHDRFASMDRMADALANCIESCEAAQDVAARTGPDEGVSTGSFRPGRVPFARWVAAIFVIGVCGAVTWQLLGARAARQQLSQLELLARTGRTFEAYDLATRLRSLLGDDSRLSRVTPLVSSTLTISSHPPGANVYLSRIETSPDGAVSRPKFVGLTPIVNLEIARGDYVIQVEKDGYVPFRRSYSDGTYLGTDAPIIFPAAPLVVRLARQAITPAGMVFVPGGEYRLKAPNRPTDAQVTLDDYFIDACEVTNRDYREFVVDGGYEEDRYWTGLPSSQGRRMELDEVRENFTDRTGLVGPRGWSHQMYPPGLGTHPVSGISWYEAAAYASYRGKRLPSIFQWEKAARDGTVSPLGVTMPWGLHQGLTDGRANFGTNGAVAVGQWKSGMSPFGCYEMAGNVSEWCSNETSKGFVAAGGSWASLPQAWSFYAIYPASHRSLETGFRCVKNATASAGDQGAMQLEIEDVTPRVPPAPSTVVGAWLGQFETPQGVLDARVVEQRESGRWRCERIQYNGADGHRTTAYLYLPRNSATPHQVIHLLPAGDVRERIRTVPQSIEADYAPFIEAGRAVFAVVLSGYLERDRPARWVEPAASSAEYLDEKAKNIRDLRRGVDYLLTRDDIAQNQIVFLGSSIGGPMMVLPAVESRYSAVVLVGAGITARDHQRHPAVNPINYAPLIRAPKLLIHGQYDESVPLTLGAARLYELLPEPRYREIFSGGHRPDPVYLASAVGHWLDQTLRPQRPDATEQ